MNDIENALAEGSEIDAIVTSNLRILHNEWILAQFDQSPFYIIVNKNDTELPIEIKLSLEKLFNDEPHLLNTLWNTYYTSKRDANIPFTISERDYIEKMKDHTFTAIISPDRAPYTFYSENKPSGIIYDIALKVIERSGLNIKFIYAPDQVLQP